MSPVEIKEINRSKGKNSPIYLQLVKKVREAIEMRKIMPGDYLPSSNQLAQRWKVGRSTINAVLDKLEKDGAIRKNAKWGKGSLVLDTPREKRNYICRFAFLRWSSTAQFLALERGAAKYANENNIELISIDLMESVDKYIGSLLHAPADTKGLILYPWDHENYNNAIKAVLERGLKVVFVDRSVSGFDCSSVSADHFKGSYESTRHLFKNMHNQPVYFLGYSSSPTAMKHRFRGYSEAMSEMGYLISHDSQYVFPVTHNESNMASITHDREKLMDYLMGVCGAFLDKCGNRKMGVCCVNDDMAYALVLVAEKRGLKIGKDILLTGFGDKPLCARLPVPLSSVAQYDETVGYEAAKLLFEKISGQQTKSIDILIPTDLIIRESSKDV